MNIKKSMLFLNLIFLTSNPIKSINFENLRHGISLETVTSVGLSLGLGVGSLYLINPFIAAIHELGHGIALKLLFNASANYTFAFFPWNNPSYTIVDKEKVPTHGKRLALMHASGTVFALAAIYTLSKSINCGLQWYNGGSLLEGFIKEIQTPLLSKNTTPALHILYGGLIISQLLNLIPRTYDSWNFKSRKKTDGMAIIDALWSSKEKEIPTLQNLTSSSEFADNTMS